MDASRSPYDPYGTFEARVARLTNALRWQNAATPGWAMVIAKDEAEARNIVLEAISHIKDKQMTRSQIAFSEHASTDKIKRYRVEIIA
jgi:hypothetical protein